MHKPDKSFFVNAAPNGLFIWGILLMLLSYMHIGIAIASIAANTANIVLRRSCGAVLPLILTLPMILLSLINSLYFESLLPLWLFLISIPVAALLSLALQLLHPSKP